MGLFRLFDESVHDAINQNAMAQHKNMLSVGAKHAGISKSQAKTISKMAGIKKGDGAFLQLHKMNKLSQANGGPNITKGISKSSAIRDSIYNKKSEDKYGESRFASGRKPLNAAASLLGISDEELYELSEGNCNSNTCKCKGGTCPVEVTDGISTSSAAAKKLANAGHTNQSDLTAVTPNAEYNQQNDAKFIGDGDSPETSKTNIPAILAARTAGGAPHGWTTDNGINGTGPNVFKLKKLKDDYDGPNG